MTSNLQYTIKEKIKFVNEELAKTTVDFMMEHRNSFLPVFCARGKYITRFKSCHTMDQF